MFTIPSLQSSHSAALLGSISSISSMMSVPVAFLLAFSVSPARAQSPEPQPEVLDVTVRGDSEGQRLRESAAAVTVIETEEAQKQTADLGEVLARSKGVGVRRSGGLGSGARFSLNGLTDDQIRFFLDGLPLELSGYPFGLANVPVNLVERAEVYRGVVPIRFGADALGGAVNLVTDDELRGSHAAASYQTGSFGTHRGTLVLHHLQQPIGLFVRMAGFVDQAKNDYPIDVDIADERGRLSPARVKRFHDGYRAMGGNLEVGVVGRPWAKRLLLRGFATGYEKQLQHNVVMTVPYGDVEYGELNAGLTLRYEQVIAEEISVDFVGGYSYGQTHFVDDGDCVYTWRGQCVRERLQRGEIEARPRDQMVWDKSGFGRLLMGWQPHWDHRLSLSVAPTYFTRTGDERLQLSPQSRDPLTAQRDVLSLVSGLEYELTLIDDQLENIAFAKDYFQSIQSDEPLPGGLLRARDRNTHRFGVGDSLRFRILDELYVKASYEWATRLPRPDEIFGDALLVIDNLELNPETSHNFNLGLTLDARGTVAGDFRLDVNGFLREADELIVLLGNDRVFSYQNVFGARSLGTEGSVGWTSNTGLLALDMNATYQGFRNTSSEGTFGDFEGDRIPNRPYLFANGSARLQWRHWIVPADAISLVWNSRYVHEFFRGWESVGLREFKQSVDSQLVHSLAVTYELDPQPTRMTLTAEMQNVTDSRAFDFFGVQRPGRALYFKTTVEL